MDDKPANFIPTLLYGYGGFGYTIKPVFSITKMMFMTNFKGMYCVPNLRGGGVYGEEWHKDGSLRNKQNSFDDFIAAAEYLISKGYTSSKHLTIQGGSNGGLLVAAVSNQRPELFAGAICSVPVIDMLRFHKFTVGHFWTSEYGNSEEGDVDYLLKYSPLHTVKKSVYPAMLVITGDHDDRVVPLHSYKYVAELQYTAG